jgi:parallel beta-helix repeat protein
MSARVACQLVLGVATMLAAAPAAVADDVVVSSSIQAAVDAASPGDTVVVPPGRYHESVRVAKRGITIRGSHGAVLDASGFAAGIRVATASVGPNCPAPTLSDITIDGMRIENASFTGVLLRGVDGFVVRDGVYTDNEEYAIFPICSQDGTIEGNHVEGTDDAAIYVGNSHDVAVERNHATDSTVGIEIENSTGLVVRDNTAIGNTSGIVTFVLPGLAVPVTEDVLVERNVVMHNNRPNPVLPSEDVVGLIPTGSGILVVGADRVTVRENRVVGNDSGGIAVIALPFPNPDHASTRPPTETRSLATSQWRTAGTPTRSAPPTPAQTSSTTAPAAATVSPTTTSPPRSRRGCSCSSAVGRRPPRAPPA